MSLSGDHSHHLPGEPAAESADDIASDGEEDANRRKRGMKRRRDDWRRSGAAYIRLTADGEEKDRRSDEHGDQ
jgi:hypothetical protein